MIVRIHANGKSFKGTAAYLNHDAEKAKTSERVAWTHTHNLANDHVDAAVNEMYWMAEDAELLKQEAGIRGGGRSTENTVKHFSLNWALGENPTREHMIKTTEEFLQHMGWQDHQAIFFAHDDKTHKHVHVMLNAVHPETGLRLNDDFERRRAQAWAKEYENENGIYCEQRFKDPAEREKNPPRNIWTAFQENEKEFARDEKLLRENQAIFAEQDQYWRNFEWEKLKEIQKYQRLAFFEQGRAEFRELRNSIYQEIRGEFRERWSNYYSAVRAGEPLNAVKHQLIFEQKIALEMRRDEACKVLRESRDERYQLLLEDQGKVRAELRERQRVDLDNAAFFNNVPQRQSARENLRSEFRAVANDLGRPQPEAMVSIAPGASNTVEHEEGKTISGGNQGRSVEHRVRRGIIGFFDTLAFDLINLGSARPEPAPTTNSSGRSLIEVAAEDATKQQLQHAREEEDAEWRRRRSRGE